MGWEIEIPDVVPEQPIESAWGNEVRDKIVHVVATVAALPVVPDGGVAYVEADDKLYLRRLGAWGPSGPGGFVALATSTSTQAITTLADITGLTVTWTALANRRYKVSALIQTRKDGNIGSPAAYIATGAGSWIVRQQIAGSANYYLSFTPFVLVTPPAGSVTYKCQMDCDSGNVQLQHTASIPHQLLVEDIGPV